MLIHKHRGRRIFTVTVVTTLLFVSASLFGQSTTFYVATVGDDSWSGLLPEPNPEGADGPFHTLQAARDAIRILRAENGGDLPDPVEVQVREGVYPMTGALTLTYEDRGDSAAPVTYRAFPGEEAVISGGLRIQGWEQNGDFWTVQIPEVQSGELWFSALAVDGELLLPARDPNPMNDPRDSNGDGFFNTAGTVEGDRKSFYYTPGDIQTYQNIDDVLVTVMHNWDTSYHRIANIDQDSSIVTFTAAPLWNFENGGPGQRYCVFHAFEALDEPGEWYLDRPTGTLTYWPREGETIQETQIVAPVVEQLIKLSGTEGEPVEYIHLKELHFAYTEYTFGPLGLSNWQAAIIVPAAISMEWAANCSVEDCEISHISNYALGLRGGCRNDTVFRNLIHDVGAGGIAVGSIENLADTSCAFNTVDNNWIYDCGKIFPGAVGVWIGRSSHNTVSHNEISQLYQTGISVGWSWGYDPSTSHHNLIEYNHIHHIGRNLLSDLGGVYTLGISPGTVVRSNFIHDVSAAVYGGWGIYLDEGSSEILVEKNMASNTTSGGFHLHYGRDNTVENNILVFSHRGQVLRSALEYEDHVSLNLVRNIIYFNNGRLFEGAWSDGNYTIDYNCYWDVSQCSEMLFPFGFFSEWQDSGYDTHGIIEDPLFLDPDNGDFTLDPFSPAITQLGFEPIEMSEAGLYGPPEWVGGPSELEYEPVPLPVPPEEVHYFFDFEDTPPGSVPRGWINRGDTDSSGVFVTDEAAARGNHSLKLQDAEGLEYLYDPHTYLEPSYHCTYAVARCWLRLTDDAELIYAWRYWAYPEYKVGPELVFDQDGLKVNHRLIRQIPRNQWFTIEIGCALGDNATGGFNLSTWIPGQSWQVHYNLACVDPDFFRVNWLGLMSNSDSFDAIYVDEFDLFTTITPPGGYESDREESGPQMINLNTLYRKASDRNSEVPIQRGEIKVP